MNDDEDPQSHQLQSGPSLVSKRKRPSSSRTSALYNGAALTSLSKNPATPRFEVLKSAFRPPVRLVTAKYNWSRDVEMVVCNFTRTSSRYTQEGPRSGQVEMEVLKKRDVIEVKFR